MSAASACPQCHRHVSLPATDDRTAWVRCPHCQSEYALGYALDYVPPPLEIVTTPATTPMPAMAGGAQGGVGELELESLPGEHPAMPALPGEAGIEHPGGEPLTAEHAGELGVHDFADELHVAEHGAGEHAADEIGFHDGVNGEHAADGEHFDHDGQEMGEHEFRFSDEHAAEGAFGEATADEHAEGVEGHGEEHAAMGGLATMVKAAPPRRVKKPVSMKVKVIGISIFIACNIVLAIALYSASLFFLKSDPINIGRFFPSFINRAAQTADTGKTKKPASKITTDKGPQSGTGGAPNGGLSSGKLANPPATPDNTATNPAGPPKLVADDVGKTNPAGTGNPATPDGGLERTDDPFKNVPADPSKSDPTKLDPLAVQPPKLNLPDVPTGLPAPSLTPKSPEKTAPTAPTTTDSPPDQPPAKTTDKPADTTPKLPEKTSPEKTSPVPIEKPADNPPAKVQSAVGPKSPATYKFAELETAADAARKARDALDAATTGDADAAKHARIDYYKVMSHLGTLLAGKIDVGSDLVAGARVDALTDELLMGPAAATLSAGRDQFGALAGKWVASPARKEAGVLLIGRLTHTQPAGQTFASDLALFGSETALTVASTADPMAGGLKAGDAVIVIGAIVDDPAENLTGYEGNMPRVVWAAKIVPCPVATPADTKIPDSKAPDTKSPDAKTPDAKSSDTKPADAKSSQSPAETKAK